MHTHVIGFRGRVMWVAGGPAGDRWAVDDVLMRRPVLADSTDVVGAGAELLGIVSFVLFVCVLVGGMLWLGRRRRLR
jgi:hypothetical protein